MARKSRTQTYLLTRRQRLSDQRKFVSDAMIQNATEFGRFHLGITTLVVGAVLAATLREASEAGLWERAALSIALFLFVASMVLALYSFLASERALKALLGRIDEDLLRILAVEFQQALPEQDPPSKAGSPRRDPSWVGRWATWFDRLLSWWEPSGDEQVLHQDSVRAFQWGAVFLVIYSMVRLWFGGG